MKKFFTVCSFFFLLFFAYAQQDYSHNVVCKGNQVYLRGFRPMQQKGKTCSYYSTSMILAYYGYNISPDKLKRKGKNDYLYPNRKCSDFIAQKLNSMGFMYSYTREKNKDFFCELIKYLIDRGIPLRWECNMRFSPIPAERNNSQHARIITGYIGKNGITHIFYSDSWGSRHINKIMDVDQALKMTFLYGPVFPKRGNQKIIDDLKNIYDEFQNRKNPPAN